MTPKRIFFNLPKDMQFPIFAQDDSDWKPQPNKAEGNILNVHRNHMYIADILVIRDWSINIKCMLEMLIQSNHSFLDKILFHVDMLKGFGEIFFSIFIMNWHLLWQPCLLLCNPLRISVRTHQKLFAVHATG